MRIDIDLAFVREWAPKYEEKDEGDYDEVIALVAADRCRSETISECTFRRIWKWKGVMRVMRHVRLEQYATLYAEAFRRAFSAPPKRKLYVLIDPASKLPGIGAPTGSTILHFMHPNQMPIIDVRTVGVLCKAGLLASNGRELKHYEPYRQAIYRIRAQCPCQSLRQIDRALFAYHKARIDKKACAAAN
jgi:hypothetical protein